jgi:hypothetical protein
MKLDTVRRGRVVVSTAQGCVWIGADAKGNSKASIGIIPLEVAKARNLSRILSQAADAAEAPTRDEKPCKVDGCGCNPGAEGHRPILAPEQPHIPTDF